MRTRAICLSAVLLAWASVARAYVEIPYTLGRTMSEATNIVVMEVVKVNKERRLIYYKKIADLKGKHPSDTINHQITNGFGPREPKFIMDWAEVGKIAIFFHNGGASETCIGDYWYQCYAGNPWWSMSHSEPFFSWCFSGNPEKLKVLVTEILAGKEVVCPCAQFPADPGKIGEWKNLMHDKKAPLWRMKASLKLTDYDAMMRDRKKYVVGLGALGPEAVPGFVAKLKHESAKERAAAAEELGQIGNDAKPAVGPLAEVLKDKDGTVRIKAAEALLRIEAGNAPALAVLTESLKDQALTPVAVDTLGGVGTGAKPAVPALIAVLGDARSAVKFKAADALLKIDPNVKEAPATLIALLGDGDKAIRIGSAELLGTLGAAAKPAVPALMKTMSDPDGEVRVKAAETLGKLAPDSVPALIAGLKDANAGVRSVCLDALAGAGGHGAPAVPTLIAMLKDPEPGLRVKAGVVLRPFAGQAGAAVPSLIEILKVPGREGRIMAASILADIGPGAKDAIPDLVNVMKTDTSGTVRMTCAATLGRIGVAAKHTAPDILAGLQDPLIAKRDISQKSVWAAAYLMVQGPPTGPTAELFGDNAGLTVLQLLEGGGQATVETADKIFGNTSLKVTPDQKFSPAIGGWNFPIVEKPQAGQFRYIRFAWKKVGGAGVMMQLSQGGDWNRRYVAGNNVINAQPAVVLNPKLPKEWVIETRDLFADFKGPFTITGIAITPMDGNFVLVDGIYLGRTIEELDKVMPAKK